MLACGAAGLGLHVRPNAFGNALGESLARGSDPTRDPSSKYYLNEMDRQDDAYRPGFNYNYRNGSDVESDNAYAARRDQESISQSDAILSRKAADALANTRDRALASENWNAAVAKVQAEDAEKAAAEAPAALRAQHARADAYGRELAAARRASGLGTRQLTDADGSMAGAEGRRFSNGASFSDLALGSTPGSGGSSSLSGWQRTQAHALGVYDAGAGAAEGAGYSFSVVGTPESRAAWAVQTSKATVEGIRSFINDPKGAVSGWWDNLTGDDPAAIRQATAQGAGIAVGAATGIVAGRLQAAPVSGLHRTLAVGDVYSPQFVGPVQWEYYYRGDSALRSEFLSSMAQTNGLQATQSFLSTRSTGALGDILAEHGVSSSTSPFVSTSRNPHVAEYFARGPSQTQEGIVTTFRVEAREAAALEVQGRLVRNVENPMSFMEPNPAIGLPEAEFLFGPAINPRYIYQQVPVRGVR